MKCRQCRHPETKVLESRESKDGLTIRRRRECQNCGARFTTFEREEEQPLFVIKRDASRELFNREKVVRSMGIACQKRSVSARDIDAIADWIERSISSCEGREMSTTAIGEHVLEALRVLDSVAYVRFASVYRAFSGPEDFAEELKRLSHSASASAVPEELVRSGKR